MPGAFSLFVKSMALGAIALWCARLMYVRRNRRQLQPGAVVLITGGGSGLGVEFAKIFSRAECKVVLVGRKEDALQAAVQQCIDTGAPQANYIVADLTTEDGCAAVASAFHQLHGERLKYLVLNAGAGAIVPFNTTKRFTEVCEEMMAVNYLANVRLLQSFLPQLERNNAAALNVGASPCMIVVISSLAGVLPSILRSSYTASKHAIQGFMNALRGETAVPITVCCPGYVDTDFHQRVLTADGNPLHGNTRRGISPERCAAGCINGALSGDREVIFTLAGNLGYVLRPLLTSIVDDQAKKKSLKSLEH